MLVWCWWLWVGGAMAQEVPADTVEPWAQLRAALESDDLTAARAHLAAVPGPGRLQERLLRWERCRQSLTANDAAVLRGMRLTMTAVTSGADRAKVQELAREAPGCAAAHALVAQHRRGSARIGALHSALARARDDAGLMTSLGRALLAEGRGEEAAGWLQQAHELRPHTPPILLARALAASDRLVEARALLAEAARKHPDNVAVVLARADLAPNDRSATVILREASDRISDPRIAARLPAPASAPPKPVRPVEPLPPLDDDEVSEVVVVWATSADEELQKLVGEIQELGYGDSKPGRNGQVSFSAVSTQRPGITLHPDGRFEIQRAGLVPVQENPMRPGRTVLRMVSTRRLSNGRAEVMDVIGPRLHAWRAAVATERFDGEVDSLVGQATTRIWKDGRGLRDEPLATVAARRKALLDYWATRTCTEEGETVRAAINAFIVDVVQTSAHPLTTPEVRHAEENNVCGVPLQLPGRAPTD